MADPLAPATGDPLVHRIPGFSTIIPHPKDSCVASDRLAAIAIGSEAPALPRLSPPLSFHDPSSRQG
jgi:hypothetical protein